MMVLLLYIFKCPYALDVHIEMILMMTYYRWNVINVWEAKGENVGLHKIGSKLVIAEIGRWYPCFAILVYFFLSLLKVLSKYNIHTSQLHTIYILYNYTHTTQLHTIYILYNFGHLMPRADSFEKTLCWERLKAGGEGDNRGWDGWMASPTQGTWVWVNSGSWWWTGRPGVLQSMGPQRVRHDWATELSWTGTTTYYTIHPFKVHNLMTFVCSELCLHHHNLS